VILMTETGPSSGRIWWIIGIGFVSAWCLYLFFYGPKAPLPPPALEGTALRQPADYDWTLRDLDGREVPFSQYRGKTIFLNIWATWCSPCVAELPAIARLARSRELGQVAFVCVSTDDDPETVRRFLRGKDWPMTILHATGLPEVFTTQGIPATFLIAPDGHVAASSVGSAAWDDPSVVTFLRQLAPKAGLP
jgi:thiol-disulfide isomerase/thioredoxin